MLKGYGKKLPDNVKTKMMNYDDTCSQHNATLKDSLKTKSNYYGMFVLLDLGISSLFRGNEYLLAIFFTDQK
jgi:hypothetical protein